MGTPTFLKPEFSDFENCIGYAKQLYQDMGGRGSEGDLATIVGNKPTSSWFTLKLNAMRGYGLIEIEGNEIRITRLAEGIIRPRDEHEERQSLIAALRGFPFFEPLVTRYEGKKEPGPQFVKNILEADGRVKPNRASEWASCFLKAARYSHFFEADMPPLPKEDKPNPPPGPKPPEGTQLLTQNEVAEGWLVYPVPVAKGVARIIVPRDLPRQAWEKMKKLLDAIEPENKNGPEGPS